MLVALAEMMLAGNQGASITLPDTLDPHSWCFAENQSSYIIATNNPDQLIRNAQHAQIPLIHLGKSISNQELKISNGDLISLKELRNSYETGLRNRLEK